MLARSDAEHHVPICEHGRYGIYTSRESLAKKNYIRANVLMLHAQQLAGSAKALTELKFSIGIMSQICLTV